MELQPPEKASSVEKKCSRLGVKLRKSWVGVKAGVWGAGFLVECEAIMDLPDFAFVRELEMEACTQTRSVGLYGR